MSRDISICFPLRDNEMTIPSPFYRWRKEYGGLKVDKAKWLKDPEPTNPCNQARSRAEGH
jgi:predicted  nucleic acid-binding Zn ribbon protein